MRLSYQLSGGDCYKIVNGQLNNQNHAVDYSSYYFAQKQVNLIFNIVTNEGEVIAFKTHYQHFKILNWIKFFVFIFYRACIGCMPYSSALNVQNGLMIKELF